MRGVTKVYQMGDVEVHALRGIDLDILPGEMVAIMGPSGSGKSTLMNIIGCLDVPTSGSYQLDGVDVSKFERRPAGRHPLSKIGFVFQNFNLLATHIGSCQCGTAADLCRHPAAANDVIAPPRRWTMVGLGDRLDHKPNELPAASSSVSPLPARCQPARHDPGRRTDRQPGYQDQR